MALLGNLKGSAQAFLQPDFYNGIATQSLRFEDGDSSYLYRTPSSAGNRRTFTFSAWIKRGNLDANNVGGGSDTTVMSAGTSDIFSVLRFVSQSFTTLKDVLQLYTWDGSADYSEENDKSFRDVSAWYHIVMAVDTTQSTAGNRVKFYINGTLQTAIKQYYAQVPQNHETSFNSTEAHWIGRNVNSTGRYFDGYMAEINFVDGTQYDASYFGETKNGVWIAKTPNVTYGTNGFRLQFKEVGGSANASGIGADTSGNGNHFSIGGLGGHDSNWADSPENNFCILNPLHYLTASSHMSEGNLQLTHESTAHRANIGSMLPETGKWYFEVYNKTDTAGSTVAIGVGLQDISKAVTYATGADNYVFYSNNNNARFTANTSTTTLSTDGTYTPGAGAVIQVAYDADSGKLFIGLNNTYIAADAGNDGDPANGNNPTATLSTSLKYLPFVGVYNNEATANFGQDSTFDNTISAGGNTDENGIGDFKYAVPSGFLALCTSNMPEPTIGPNSETQADDHHNTVLYTGNGGTLSVSGFGHQPDWLWIKSLSITGNHRLTDSTRGVSANVIAQALDEEKGDSDPEDIDSFDSDGFTVTQATYDDFNDSGDSYVAWSWKANGGTTTSHSAGDNSATEASVSQANTTSGFSIVTYTGDTSGHGSTYPSTFNHGLGKTPRMIWTKSRSTNYSWAVYHEDMNTGSSYNHTIELDSSDARSSANNAYWGGNTMTLNNNLFSIGSDNTTGANGVTYVAYLFADVEGYSKIGKYTGNGDNDGPFVYTGFRPAWVLIKNITSALNWSLYDDTRFGVGTTQTINPVMSHIVVNNNNAEFDSVSYPTIDIVSNGFKVRIGGTGSTIAQNLNKSSSDVFIYMAFAHQPFKYANAL